MIRTTDPLDFEAILNSEENNNKSEKLELLNILIKENYSTENIFAKTELNETEVRVYSVGLLFGERYENKLVTNLIENLMKLKLSKGRKSRKEAVDISKSLLGKEEPQAPDPELSFKNRILGR